VGAKVYAPALPDLTADDEEPRTVTRDPSKLSELMGDLIRERGWHGAFLVVWRPYTDDQHIREIVSAVRQGLASGDSDYLAEQVNMLRDLIDLLDRASTAAIVKARDDGELGAIAYRDRTDVADDVDLDDDEEGDDDDNEPVLS
jgi:hypothetical protein